jgi:hypothetical protein
VPDSSELHPIIATLAGQLEERAGSLWLPSEALAEARRALRHADDEPWEHLLAWTHAAIRAAGEAAAGLRAQVLELLAERLGSDEDAADRFAELAPGGVERAFLGQSAPRRAPVQSSQPEPPVVRVVRGLGGRRADD